MSWDKWVECLEYLMTETEASDASVTFIPSEGVQQLELALEPDMDIPGGDLVDS